MDSPPGVAAYTTFIVRSCSRAKKFNKRGGDAATQARNAGPVFTINVMDTVYLNHFFVTIDAESYKAIESSPFLRDEFAPFEQRTTVRQDTSYTGIYFCGAHTYFEFFEAGSGLGRMTGASGVAFGVEAAGTSQRLKPRLEAALGVPVAVRPITRRTGDRDADWFYMTAAAQPSPLLV